MTPKLGEKMNKKSGFLKITGGDLRGRKIATPGGATHPMGERERLALFNILSGRIAGASVLDAYAGSGALGVEALSRGAKKVTFIEKNPVAAEIIRQNLKELDLRGNSELIKGKIPEVFGTITERFGVILADPPYDAFDLSGVEALVNLLQKGGILVLSHPDEAPDLQGVVLQKTHQYAGAHISIYTKD